MPAETRPNVVCNSRTWPQYNTTFCQRYRGEPTGRDRMWWNMSHHNRTAESALRVVIGGTLGAGLTPVTPLTVAAKVGVAAAEEILRQPDHGMSAAERARYNRAGAVADPG